MVPGSSPGGPTKRAVETVIVKHFMNPYRETPLKVRLDSRGIENVTVLGDMSQVHAAFMTALQFGYANVVSTEAFVGA